MPFIFTGGSSEIRSWVALLGIVNSALSG